MGAPQLLHLSLRCRLSVLAVGGADATSGLRVREWIEAIVLFDEIGGDYYWATGGVLPGAAGGAGGVVPGDADARPKMATAPG